MSRNKTEGKEASIEETREAERAKWIEEQQVSAVKANEPIKDVFRVTVAIDVCVDSVDAARASVKELKGEGIFVYGFKGVRRLESLFQTSEAFKRISEQGKQRK